MSAAIEQVCTPTRRFQVGMVDDDFDWLEVQLAVLVDDFFVYRWLRDDWKSFLNGGVKGKMRCITESEFLVVEEWRLRHI